MCITFKFCKCLLASVSFLMFRLPLPFFVFLSRDVGKRHVFFIALIILLFFAAKFFKNVNCNRFLSYIYIYLNKSFEQAHLENLCFGDSCRVDYYYSRYNSADQLSSVAPPVSWKIFLFPGRYLTFITVYVKFIV